MSGLEANMLQEYVRVLKLDKLRDKFHRSPNSQPYIRKDEYFRFYDCRQLC